MAITAQALIEEQTNLTIKGVKGVKGFIDDKHLGRLRPTPKDTSLAELRRRLDEDGYLFIKNLIPRSDVLRVRKE